MNYCPVFINNFLNSYTCDSTLCKITKQNLILIFKYSLFFTKKKNCFASRFSPTGVQRYNTFSDPYLQTNGMLIEKLPVGNSADYSAESSNVAFGGGGGGFGTKRKPKPFSVMLDIYPITDMDQNNKKTMRPRPSHYGEEEFEHRKAPFTNFRGPKMMHSAQTAVQPIPIIAIPSADINDDHEKQQMIFHLNLYPRKKPKFSRYI